MTSRRRNPLVKIAVGLLILTGIAVLFWRTLDDARAEPYTVRAQHLSGWTLAEGVGAESALIGLQPPPELPMRLFRQVFSRAGESLSTPAAPGIPLVLRAELAGAAAPPSAADLLALAREAGLDGLTLTPSCMGYRRESGPGSIRQLFFVLFDMPEFTRFRAALAARVNTPDDPAFQPGALSPVMMMAAAQPDFSRWMPITADPAADCIAPVVLEAE